jgi:GNAT superfamily N-acetyltransferase
MYYIHDIAILPDFKGRGYARVCVDKIGEVARGYEMTGLVSVYGTRGFWGRFGFAEIVGDEGMRVKMVEYGEDAVWLERRNEVWEGE